MKRLAAIILSALLLFSFTACDFSNYDSSVEESTADEAGSDVADFSSYEAIIETYKSIVNCFPRYSVDQYQKSEYTSTLTFPDAESRAIYDKIFSSAYYNYKNDYAVKYLEDGRNYFGYALYDINKNGSDELILLNDHYNIIAIFSNTDRTPRLVVDNEPCCRIDSNGRIYTQELTNGKHELFPWSDRYYDMKIYTLSDKDELTLTEEYLADTSFGSDQVFFDITDGKSIEITKAEYLEKTHDYLYNDEAACITQSSINLDFVRLFDPIDPQISDIYSWMWYEYKDQDQNVVMLHNKTATTIDIGFYSKINSGWGRIAWVTATRSGEKAYFESETLSGRLEFGLDCIWIIITESQSEEFPCGAYIYQYYEIVK